MHTAAKWKLISTMLAGGLLSLGCQPPSYSGNIPLEYERGLAGNNGTFGQPPSQNAAAVSPPPQPAPAEEIDLGNFPYERRVQFRQLMSAHLNSVEERLILSNKKVSQQQAPDVGQKIEELLHRQTLIDQKAKRADVVPENSWNQYKSSLKEDVSNLESRYQEVDAALAKAE